MAANEAKNAGNAAFVEGNFSEAVKLYTEAINASPSDHIIYSNRSASHASLGDFLSALSDAKKTVDLKPNWSKGHNRLATAYIGLRRYSDAINAYKRGLEFDPTNLTLRSGLEAAMLSIPEKWDKLGEDPAMIRFFNQPDFTRMMKVIRRDPTCLKEYFNDQRVFLSLGVLVEDDYFDEYYCKRLNEEGLSFLTDRAATYLEIGKYEDCIKDCDKVVKRSREIRSDFKMVAKALSRKGTAIAKMAKCSKDLELAIEVFQKALAEHRNPDTLKKLNDAEKAKEVFESKKGNEFVKLQQNLVGLKLDPTNLELTDAVKEGQAPEDEMYFQFYGELGSQQSMLDDKVRTEMYHDAIMENPADFKGKVVVDVGAGSGILSLFAAKAGAIKVYAVEASTIVEFTRKLLEGNLPLATPIEVVHSSVEKAELPEKADVLISEPLGFLLVHERMLESYLHARDQFLLPGGKMYPETGTIYLAPYEDKNLHAQISREANFWRNEDFHGIDLTPLYECAMSSKFGQPILIKCDARSVIGTPATHTLDFTTMQLSELHDIEIPFDFRLPRTVVDGMVCWFDVEFPGRKHILTTNPGAKETHWANVVCLFRKPIHAWEGMRMAGRFCMLVNESRSYSIRLSILGIRPDADFELDKYVDFRGVTQDDDA